MDVDLRFLLTMYMHPQIITLLNYTRVIQKISSICEYCLCSTVVTMEHTRAEFVDSVARHGRNLQTFEHCLRIVPCVCNV